MKKDKVIVVNHDNQKGLGRKMAVYQRVCNAYKCEDIEIDVNGSEAYGISQNRLIITGLAVTHRPRDPIYIPRETFENFGKNLIGKPLADGHGDFPWSAITVDEMLGVVIDAWYSEEKEALMFKAEVWDEKAVEALKRKIYVNFSVAYWYEYELDKIINEYDEDMDVIKVTELEFDHIAYLPNPQVPESELQTVEEMQKHSSYSCLSDDYKDNSDIFKKTYRHNSTIKEDEPSWGDVDKTRLPWNAFSNWKVLDKDKKSTWKYPHHWINMSKMYLHRGGLIYALAAAKGARSGKKASPEVFSHLNRHVKAIKLSYQEFCEIVEEQWDSISDDLKFSDIDDIIKDEDIVKMFGGSDMTKETEEVPTEEEEQEEDQEEVHDETVTETVVGEPVVTPEESESEEEPDEQEQDGEEEEEVSVEEPVSEENAVEQTANADAFTEKLASLMNELRAKEQKITELESKILAYETDKREAVLLSKVESYINDKKVLPKNKDDIFNLLKTMTDDQVEKFFDVIEKNTVYPSGEKGKVPTPDAHSEENEDEETENKRFFT